MVVVPQWYRFSPILHYRAVPQIKFPPTIIKMLGKLFPNDSNQANELKVAGNQSPRSLALTINNLEIEYSQELFKAKEAYAQCQDEIKNCTDVINKQRLEEKLVDLERKITNPSVPEMVK